MHVTAVARPAPSTKRSRRNGSPSSVTRTGGRGSTQPPPTCSGASAPIRRNGRSARSPQKRAQRLADEGLNRVAGVSRQVAQVLGDIADKSPGLASALKGLGAGFAVFETFKIGTEIGTAIRNFAELGESTENYQKRLELV